MDAFTARLFVATLLFVILSAFYLGLTGAPPRVDLVTELTLALGAAAPAIFVSGPVDVARKWVPLLLWFLGTTFLFDLLGTLVIVKHELFGTWTILYPLCVIALFGLAIVHGLLVSFLRRLAKPSPDATKT